MDGEAIAGRYDLPLEAELAAAYLEQHDVPTRIDSDVVAGMNPWLGAALGGVRLYVPEARLEEAVALLEAVKVRRNREPRQEVDRVAQRASISAVVGVTFLPLLGTLYSLWLLIGIDGRKLSKKGRRHRRFAWFINLAVLGAVALASGVGR
jgi:hypothetical protein